MGRHLFLLASLALALWTSLSDGAVLENTKCGVAANQTTLDTFPETKVRYEAFNASSRRKLGDFRECAPCTCCTDATRKFCFLTVCCYNINCSLRRVPFGLCSFTPVSCNCFGCS